MRLLHLLFPLLAWVQLVVAQESALLAVIEQLPQCAVGLTRANFSVCTDQLFSKCALLLQSPNRLYSTQTRPPYVQMLNCKAR
jgi:hypothetical protein